MMDERELDDLIEYQKKTIEVFPRRVTALIQDVEKDIRVLRILKETRDNLIASSVTAHGSNGSYNNG